MTITYLPKEGRDQQVVNGILVEKQGLTFNTPQPKFETLVNAGFLRRQEEEAKDEGGDKEELKEPAPEPQEGDDEETLLEDGDDDDVALADLTKAELIDRMKEEGLDFNVNDRKAQLLEQAQDQLNGQE